MKERNRVQTMMGLDGSPLDIDNESGRQVDKQTNPLWLLRKLAKETVK